MLGVPEAGLFRGNNCFSVDMQDSPVFVMASSIANPKAVPSEKAAVRDEINNRLDIMLFSFWIFSVIVDDGFALHNSLR